MLMIKRLISILVIAAMTASFAMAGHKVRATKYYAGHKCGTVTADGSRISVSKVHSGEHRWVALSPDMFRKGYRLGDRIKVVSSNPRLCGIWVVKDKMGPRKRNSIDFLMTRENSKDFNNPCMVEISKV